MIALAPHPYRPLFEALQAKPAPEWLIALRETALERFERHGLPSSALENWKYTPLTPLATLAARRAEEGEVAVTAAAVDALSHGRWAAARYVFVNGVSHPELGYGAEGIQGLTVRPWIQAADVRKALRDDMNEHGVEPFADLNDALREDGLLIQCAAQRELDKPIHVLWITAGKTAGVVSSPFLQVRAGELSRLHVVEQHVSLGDFQSHSNAFARLEGAAGSSIIHTLLIEGEAAAVHTGALTCRLERDAKAYLQSFSFGGGWIRNDVRVTLADKGAECTLDGLYLAKGTEQVDNHTTIIHQKPHGTSRQLYKGVLDGAATGTFNGRIVVPEDAQKTDSSQSNHNLLLSADATVNTKPQLEIFADDVKCAHGATVGQLDAESLFYFRARGIGEREARAMLTQAFALEITGKVTVPELRKALEEKVFEWIS